MASSYSQYLRLELIGTGEQTGTWGNTTNTNLGTLLDQAVAGTATIDVTAGNVTLTALNGASDQSRQAILKITGTPGAARNVVAPESSKWYLVSNECGQTITLKGASTSGYAIADGETLLMFWNGTDFVPGSSTALGYTPVNKAGDTMTGALYLPAATPTLSTQAANKAYVDAAVSGAVGGNFVLKAGDTMTGPLVLPGAPTLSLQAATKGYVDGAISNAGFATQLWVTQQSYVTTTTSSLTNYYTKTDSDNRYVSTATQNLQYYTLTSQLGTAVTNLGFVKNDTTGLINYYTSTYITTNYSTTTAINTALGFYCAKQDNLSGLNNVSTARTNLGLGSMATANTIDYLALAGSQTITGTKTFNTYPISGTGYNFTSNIGIAYSGTSIVMNIVSGTPFSFQQNGVAYASSAWNTTSDSRIKENVEPIVNGLTTISELNPVKFSYKRDHLTIANHYGLIAQEVEQITPDIVSNSDLDIDGVQDVKAVSYTEIIPILIKAVQELKAEVDALKATR